MKSTLVLLIVLGAIAMPTYAQKVTIDYAHDFDFKAVKTFQYVETTDSNATNQLMDGRIRGAIIKHLTGAGLQEVDSDPGIYVTYHMTAKDSTAVASSNAAAANSAAYEQQQAAQAQIDAAEAQQRAAEAQQQAALATQQAAQAQQALPLGSVLPSLPSGCESTSVGGQSYFTCGANWYRPVMQNGNIAYSVVANPG